jgi:hypothetical protein
MTSDVQAMYSVQGTGRSRDRYVIYGLSLILIIALSTSTTLFYLLNQSLQKDLDTNRLQELSWTAQDIDTCIGLFVGRYYDQFSHLKYILNSTPQADNASKSQKVNDVQAILRTTAVEVYGDFENYIQRIETLTNNANRTAYENISKTVYAALGEVGQLGWNYTGNDWGLEVFQLMGQLYYIIGADKIIEPPPASGLLAIAENFQSLSTWWGGYNAPPPETSLNLALANATELYFQLTTWTNYTTPIISYT